MRGERELAQARSHDDGVRRPANERAVHLWNNSLQAKRLVYQCLWINSRRLHLKASGCSLLIECAASHESGPTHLLKPDAD
jgi:hypothetical protein